jgi:cysteine-rich repeat protein
MSTNTWNSMNGMAVGGEECDDGNLQSGDFCDADCQKECILGDDSILSDDHCYMFFAEPTAWGDAANACTLLNSHLASIASSDENGLVQGLVIGTAWVGLTDQWSEGTFIWSEGVGEILAPIYEAWASSQPDNAPNDAADCVEIEPVSTHASRRPVEMDFSRPARRTATTATGITMTRVSIPARSRPAETGLFKSVLKRVTTATMTKQTVA